MSRTSRHEQGSQIDQASIHRIHRFLEPCLLLLLHCKEIHGYELIDGLNALGFEQNPANSSTVYRVLRELEGRQFVTSRWETDSPGPARRLYRLTKQGDEYLAWWVNGLRETDQVLHKFLNNYDTHMEAHQ